jgi:hypothetical protein
MPNLILHVPKHCKPAYWGPGGDSYAFLVTGEESGGSHCVVEAHVPPGGGNPSSPRRYSCL